MGDESIITPGVPARHDTREVPRENTVVEIVQARPTGDATETTRSNRGIAHIVHGASRGAVAGIECLEMTKSTKRIGGRQARSYPREKGLR